MSFMDLIQPERWRKKRMIPEKRRPSHLAGTSFRRICRIIGIAFALMAAPDLGNPDLGSIGGGLPMLVKSVLGETAGSLFLCIVIFASLCAPLPFSPEQ
jgi:hypothetical protein